MTPFTIRFIGILILTLGLLGQTYVTNGAEQDSRPNVLVLIVDDMNDYGFYKTYPGAKMPYMDEFKKTAITFRHAYCASPVCGPSRAAVFSGLYPHTTGHYLNGSDPWRKGMLTETESLPELFQRSGYNTFGWGKIFHAKLAEGREKAMFLNEVHHGGFGPFLAEEDQMLGRFWGAKGWEGPDSDFPDVRNADAAIEYLQQDHDKPFFLVYGLWRPHTPFTAPKRFFDMYDLATIAFPPPGYKKTDLSDVPPKGQALSRIWGERWDETGGSDPASWRKLLHGYLACTTFADWNCGRVIEALDAGPYADNTIVIFWSDNGFHMGEKNHYEKATAWEKAALTPMAIRLPGGKHGGKVCTRPVNTIDIFPTLMDFCSLESPEHTPDGTNLMPLLKNPKTKWDKPAITSYGERVFSARSERYRYIRYPDGLEELYDHKNDPNEFHNLANHPDMQEIIDAFDQWYPENWAKSWGGRNG